MKKRFNITVLVSLIFPIIVACGTVTPPVNSVTVLPKDCQITVNEHLPLALDGLIPPNAMILWETSAGSIISTPPGLNALFVAPAQPIVAIISISISSGTPSVQLPIQYPCIVTAEIGATPQTTIDNSIDPQPTVIISEVMANPCGDIEVKKWNEYVELYNYGD